MSELSDRRRFDRGGDIPGLDADLCESEENGASRAGRTNTEWVYETLKGAILDGTLEPGTAISQSTLFQSISVSRTPVREAIRMLQAEGWLESQPNKRARVAPLSASDVEQQFAARIALEGLAVGISVPHMADDLPEMRDLLRQMRVAVEAHDYEAWVTPHKAFHRALTRGAGEMIGQLCASLSDSTQRYINLCMKDMPMAYMLGEAEHQTIYEACEEGNSLVASSLLAKHLARTAIQLVGILDPSREPTPIRTAVKLIGDPGIDAPSTKSRGAL
ncbi:MULTISPECIES: GntR family transcriptional regulator [Rhodococcus]|uniref:Putative GntR family transcriptional regulator n=1 Tax=Rhodococcus wratislaviensis NBRC 100605 TaxID=1219028 RepID=X0Q6V1_RHOWR|nr:MULTISPECIES: GntR family transcriptional regulator [Rhodococcus]WAM19147.1 GntR family transcriptional regulator [Rhodococcus sp. JS3073]GAF47097.1 putative GntR family transcriptional regulator [Rhodococcus wratislaviensis NBRC 100605]